MRLILTSDFPASANERVVARMRSAAPSPRIAWIAPETVAADPIFTAAQQQFAALGFPQTEYVDIDEDRDEVQIAYLHEFDIVFLADGDPMRLRYNAIRSGLSGRLRQLAGANTLIVASGGGALLLTPNVSLARLLSESVEDVFATRARFDALAVVNYEVLPQPNRWDAGLMARLTEYSRRIEHDIVAIAPGSALLHDGAAAETVGRITRYRNGQIIGP